MSRTVLAILLFTLPAAGQNFLPNGNFEQGTQGWKLTKFNDPKGKTGVALGNVLPTGPSKALFADFKTLSPVMECHWLSNPFVIAPVPVTVSFNLMWEKPVTNPIPYPSVNYVRVKIQDATGKAVFSKVVGVPKQTGKYERASFKGNFKAPSVGKYRVEVFFRHSNLAKMPYIAWIDNLVVGNPTHYIFGQPCAGSGKVLPLISASGVPAIGSTNWTLRLDKAFAPSLGLLALGHSTSSWRGITLPFGIGGGCRIYTGLTLLFTAPVKGSGPGTGQASLVLPIPPNMGVLRGVNLYAQWLVVDPGSGSWTGLTTTAGLGFTIQ